MGVAAATALSNLVSMLLFLLYFWKIKERTALLLSLRHFRFWYAGEVFSLGTASALTAGLANLSNMMIVKLASGYIRDVSDNIEKLKLIS